MSRARELRRTARLSLKDKWGVAVGAGFLASLLGATGSSTSFNFEYRTEVDSQTSASTEQMTQEISQFINEHPEIISILTALIGIFSLLALASFFIGCAVEIGYSRFNIDLIDGQKPGIGTLFSYFNIYGKSLASRILRNIFVFLWSLLFIIPGIMATYSYAMTSYILAEEPELTARQAIKKSKEMMRGNRWRLFCLQLSFIGWSILNLFTLGIGSLWLVPYINATTAAFYRELAGPSLVNDAVAE